MRRNVVTFLGALLLSLSVQAAPAPDSSPALREALISNLTFMKSVYRAEYAPAEWKKSYAGWDLDAEIAKAIQSAQTLNPLTLKDARKILRSFIYSMKDYHVSISFDATESSTLPFVIRGAGDKYFLAYIDRTKLPLDSFPFSVGDEVIQFGGKATGEAVTDLMNETPPINIVTTDKALAELGLTRRRASRGIKVPKGPISLAIKSHGSVRSIQLIWEHTAETIHDPIGLDLLDIAASAPNASHLLRPQMIADVMDEKEAAPTENPQDLGARKSYTPDLGPKIWETAPDDPFYAYIYKNEAKKLIGFVRIPSYVPADSAKAIASFAKIIATFEAATDAMVIDQVNNPGGSVFYLYGLASMLSTQPLSTPQHRMAITQTDVADALTQLKVLEKIKNDEQAKVVLGASLDGYPASYETAQFIVAYLRFLVSEWNQGHKLSAPYWIAGADHINPSPTHYSKPILLLINELDFSGGDFFPAIMQDNKRVTILGTRTAGAGGYVNDVKVPNNLGIAAFRVTESIARRVDDNPIENLGVKPDLNYSLTEKDLSEGYSDYAQAIQGAVTALVK